MLSLKYMSSIRALTRFTRRFRALSECPIRLVFLNHLCAVYMISIICNASTCTCHIPSGILTEVTTAVASPSEFTDWVRGRMCFPRITPVDVMLSKASRRVSSDVKLRLFPSLRPMATPSLLLCLVVHFHPTRSEGPHTK